jgi:hypothetical protein
MTGTPSRTATALDDGVTPVTPTEPYITGTTSPPRGSVGRKLQAKPWPEEHETQEGGRTVGECAW